MIQERVADNLMSLMDEKLQTLSSRGKRKVDALLAQIQGQLADLGMPDLDSFLRGIETDDRLLRAGDEVIDNFIRLQRVLEKGRSAGEDWTRAEIRNTIETTPFEVAACFGVMQNGDALVNLSYERTTLSRFGSGNRHQEFPAIVDHESGRVSGVQVMYPSGIQQTLGVTHDGAIVAWVTDSPRHRRLVCVDSETRKAVEVYETALERQSSDWGVYYEPSETVVEYDSLKNQFMFINVSGDTPVPPLYLPGTPGRLFGVTALGHAIFVANHTMVYKDTASARNDFLIDILNEQLSVRMLDGGGVVYTDDKMPSPIYWNPYEGKRVSLGVVSSLELFVVQHPANPRMLAVFDNPPPDCPFTLCMVDTQTGEVVHRVEVENDQAICGLAVTPDEQLVVAQKNRITYIGEPS